MRFPQEARLKKRGEFHNVRRSGRYVSGEFLAISFRLGGRATARLGITVSKKYGKAHMRNRFKRVVRSHFASALPTLKPGLDLDIRPRRRALEMEEKEWKGELNELLEAVKSQTARSGEGYRRARPRSSWGGQR